jgi:opacity protein-like surface antigen
MRIPSLPVRYFLAAAASLFLITAAQAGDNKDMVQSDSEQMDGFFVGAQGGADFSSTIHTDTAANIHSDTLALGGIQGGYLWNHLPFVDWKNFTNRIGLEADWSGDHRTLGGAGFSQNNAIVLLTQSVGYKIGKFEPYVGGGLGFINTWVSGGGFHDDSDISFTYGPLVGVRYNLARHWQLFTEYKYLFTDDKSYAVTAGTLDTHTGHDQIATAGVSFLF